jgi:hypothetical protein
MKCGWGEWSLVRASLNAVEAAVEAFPRATHFYMLSGDCMAIKSAEYAHAFLDAEDADYIESFDFFASDWIKTGLKEERLIYRHFFNERTQKRLFYGMLEPAEAAGPGRRDSRRYAGDDRQPVVVPAPPHHRVDPRFHPATRRDVMRFFRTTWIPDETFFQTWCATSCPSTRSQPHADLPDVQRLRDAGDLLQRPLRPAAQPGLPLRPQDQPRGDGSWKKRLGALWMSSARFHSRTRGEKLYEFLTGRGRSGGASARGSGNARARSAPTAS